MDAAVGKGMRPLGRESLFGGCAQRFAHAVHDAMRRAGLRPLVARGLWPRLLGGGAARAFAGPLSQPALTISPCSICKMRCSSARATARGPPPLPPPSSTLNAPCSCRAPAKCRPPRRGPAATPGRGSRHKTVQASGRRAGFARASTDMARCWRCGRSQRVPAPARQMTATSPADDRRESSASRSPWPGCTRCWSRAGNAVVRQERILPERTNDFVIVDRPPSQTEHDRGNASKTNSRPGIRLRMSPPRRVYCLRRDFSR